MTKKLEKFVDALPVPELLTLRKNDDPEYYYEITMEEFEHKMHRDLPLTKVWGYNRQFPGPVIEAFQGEPIRILWQNSLPDRHLLPIDETIHHTENMPEVRTVVHLHGSETEADSDGYPDAWYTRNFEVTGPTFTRKIYEYPNRQRATTLWYHDHAAGITRLNVYAGLAGMYILRDKEEEKLNLPSGEFEIPLVVMDRSFNDDGSLFYPDQPNNPSENLPNPSVVPFFLGDTIVVNGKVWPYLEVEPRKYRFRLLNASNTRSYRFYLDNGMPFIQIGSDGGLLEHPVEVEELAMEPAERADFILNFSKFEGETITLKNNLGEDADPDDETDDVMQFRVVKPLSGPDESEVPRFLSRIPRFSLFDVSRVRYMTLSAETDEFGRPLLLLNGKKWMDEVTEMPRLGSTEIWSILNLTNIPHPIHIHLIQFQILDRRPFDVEYYNETGRIRFTGPSVPPPLNERGWKDTVSAPPGEITRIIMRFAPFTGDYVWHCHILEHEDYDMMRPLRVLPARNPFSFFWGRQFQRDEQDRPDRTGRRFLF